VACGLVTSAAVACLAAFQFGFATGVLNVPQDAITDEVGLSTNGLGWSTVVSSWCFAGLLGTQVGHARLEHSSPPHHARLQPAFHRPARLETASFCARLKSSSPLSARLEPSSPHHSRAKPASSLLNSAAPRA
jgi:hypothetical protein